MTVVIFKDFIKKSYNIVFKQPIISKFYKKCGNGYYVPYVNDFIVCIKQYLIICILAQTLRYKCGFNCGGCDCMQS